MRTEKATAAAWWFVNKHGGRIPHKKLMKLLYFTERHWLIERGVTIFEDTFYSMDEGPVLSGVYEAMRPPAKKRPEGAKWRRFLSSINNGEISQNQEMAPSDFLTRAQISLLEAIWDQFGGLTQDQIIDVAHQLPEWTDPNGSSIFIKYIDVLSSELDADEARAKTSFALTQRNITAAFGS